MTITGAASSILSIAYSSPPPRAVLLRLLLPLPIAFVTRRHAGLLRRLATPEGAQLSSALIISRRGCRCAAERAHGLADGQMPAFSPFHASAPAFEAASLQL